MHELFFITGYSFFDVWSIVHLAFWIFIGSTFWAYKEKISKKVSFYSCFALSFVWEIYEHFMAPLHPEIWKDPESFWNAWVSDPLMCVIGFLGIWFLLDKRKRK